MLKYLRIAVTALSLTACVLLIALWVRSYWWITHFGNDYISCGALDGTFQLSWFDDPSTSPGNDWYIVNGRVEDFNRWVYGSTTRPAESAATVLPNFGFGHYWMVIPIWFLAIIAVVLAVLPWLKWSRRFSLRTLLIVTTLVAVGLGILVAI